MEDDKDARPVTEGVVQDDAFATGEKDDLRLEPYKIDERDMYVPSGGPTITTFVVAGLGFVVSLVVGG